MLAFAWFWPHDQILIWGIIPIEARWMVALMTGLALFGGFTGPRAASPTSPTWAGSSAAGSASRPSGQERDEAVPDQHRPEGAEGAEGAGRVGDGPLGRIRRDNLHEVNRGELDRILDKISASGVASLTHGEREFLERFAAREQLS